MKKITLQIIRVLILLPFIQCNSYKKTNMKTSLNFYTSYHQFYIADKLCDEDTSNDFWTDEAYKDRIAFNSCGLGIGTECYGNVKGEVAILEKPIENIDLIKYDHIVEAGIEIKSGVLQILNCPNNEVEFEMKLKNGKYRVRVYSSNLATVIDDDGDDYYKIEVWPDEETEKKVIKRYTLNGDISN